MSDSTQGSPGLSPAKFHEAQGVADWRVTDSGHQAVFRATSLEQAASLVPHVVNAAAQFAVKADIDVRAEAVVVRLPYDEEWTIAATAPAFAAAVSEAAAARKRTEALAQADELRLVEEARVTAERDRMAIYRDLPPGALLGLAARDLAGNLPQIQNLSLGPEVLGPMLARLLQVGTERLEES